MSIEEQVSVHTSLYTMLDISDHYFVLYITGCPYSQYITDKVRTKLNIYELQLVQYDYN